MIVPRPNPEIHEVDQPVKKRGRIAFMSKKAFVNPAPNTLKNILAGIKYTLIGITGVLGGFKLLTPDQISWMVLILTIIVFICGGIEQAIGVVPDTEATLKSKSKR